MLSGQGRRVVYGTDDGVYLSNLWERNREPVKVLALQDVSQVDVLEDYQLLIVLSGKHRLRALWNGSLTWNRRATSHYLPAGCLGPHGSHVWPQARETDSFPHLVLQSRSVPRKDSRVCGESESAVQYYQDAGAHRPEYPRQGETYFPEIAARWQRYPTSFQGTSS